MKVKDLISIGKKYGFKPSQMAAIAEQSIRTFQAKNKLSLLSLNASEKVLQLNILYELGLKAFDNKNEALILWLNRPSSLLKNHSPNELLTTHLGIGLVKDELLRIENGIY